MRAAKVRGMDANALRNWGLAVSAALFAAALALATLGPHDAPFAALARSGDALTPDPGDDDLTVAQTPVRGADTATVAFIVRFRGNGPLARAQALAARGQEGRAGQAATAALARQSAFAGLCFERFTVGGAETVLRSCDPVPAADRAQVQQRWLARLRSMRAVAYVDVNANVTQDRTP